MVGLARFRGRAGWVGKISEEDESDGNFDSTRESRLQANGPKSR